MDVTVFHPTSGDQNTGIYDDHRLSIYEQYDDE